MTSHQSHKGDRVLNPQNDVETYKLPSPENFDLKSEFFLRSLYFNKCINQKEVLPYDVLRHCHKH
jgi:hypothetical protein